MKKTQHILLAQLLAATLITITIIILHETQIIPPGTLTTTPQATVITQFIMQFLTLTLCPLALYLFRIPPIRKTLTTPTALTCWGTLRMQMLCLPMIANIALYYLEGLSTGYFYMFLIFALCLTLIYPTQARCKKETQQT